MRLEADDTDDGRSIDRSQQNGFPGSPTESIEFGIYSQESTVPNFLPVYYPSRFTITTEKELERTASSCEGERVNISELKNSELHVTGKVHSSDLPDLDAIAHSTEPVEVITPIIVGGGMEAYIKSTERGEMIGFDAYPTAQEWMFEYTLDLVSTGHDEYDSHESSRYEGGDYELTDSRDGF